MCWDMKGNQQISISNSVKWQPSISLFRKGSYVKTAISVIFHDSASKFENHRNQVFDKASA